MPLKRAPQPRAARTTGGKSAAQVARAEAADFSARDAVVRTGEPGPVVARPETSHLRALGITVVAIVLAEIVAMGTLRFIDSSSFFLTTLLDASIMIALASPVLYVLIFRRLVRLTESCFRAQRAAEAANADLLAERERLQTLSRVLVDAQENERRAVARELHDEAGQTLTSLKIGLSLLEKTSEDAGQRARAVELLRIAEDAQESLHRLAANLRPPSLEHLGLVPALGQLVQSVSESSGVRIELAAAGFDGERLAWRMETDLYRIAQEAITNALRHARAREIDVVVERRDGRLRLLVEDDGDGFDVEASDRTDRLGLIGMRERAESLGGSLLVESRRGSGTTVVVEAPDGG